MSLELRLHLRDLSQSLVSAWTAEFTGVPGVTISRGDIFSDKKGQIRPHDPIDIQADAIVSPANSFGFMDAHHRQLAPARKGHLQHLRHRGGYRPLPGVTSRRHLC